MAVDTYALCTLANYKAFAGITDTDNDSKLEMLIDAVSDRIEQWCCRKFKSRDYTEFFDGSREQDLRLAQAPLTAVGRVSVGFVDAIRLTGTTTSAYEAYVSTSSTALTLTIKVASGDSETELAYADYATLTLLTAAATGTTGWTATLLHDEGDWASADIVPCGASHCLDPDTVTVKVFEEAYGEYDVDWDAGTLIHTGDGWPCGRRNIYVEYTAGYSSIPDDVEQAAMEMVKDAYDLSLRDNTLASEKVGSYAWAAQAVTTTPLWKSLQDRLSTWRRITLG